MAQLKANGLLLSILICLLFCRAQTPIKGNWQLVKQYRNEVLEKQQKGNVGLIINDTTFSKSYISDQIYLGNTFGINLGTFYYQRKNDSIIISVNKTGMAYHIKKDTLIFNYCETSPYSPDSTDRLSVYYIRDSGCKVTKKSKPTKRRQ